MSRPSNRIEPAVGANRPLTRLKNVVLPAPFGPMIARNSPGSMVRDTLVDGDQAAETLRCALDLKQGHAFAPVRSMPRTPRGKKRTTSTNTSPITDIQFSVWLET